MNLSDRKKVQIKMNIINQMIQLTYGAINEREKKGLSKNETIKNLTNKIEELIRDDN